MGRGGSWLWRALRGSQDYTGHGHTLTRTREHKGQGSVWLRTLSGALGLAVWVWDSVRLSGALAGLWSSAVWLWSGVGYLDRAQDRS